MNAAPSPELAGVILAGGSSRRMGEDKATIEYHGEPQVAHCARLLAPWCAQVLLSARKSQAGSAPYSDFPVILDGEGVQGPAAGLLAAWEQLPDAALLVLAVDMPLVDAELLGHLVAHRDRARAATAYRHPEGVLEPLCAIYEPSAARSLARIASREPAPSLRRFLEAADVAVLDAPEPAKLVGANSPAAKAALRTALDRP